MDERDAAKLKNKNA